MFFRIIWEKRKTAKKKIAMKLTKDFSIQPVAVIIHKGKFQLKSKRSVKSFVQT